MSLQVVDTPPAAVVGSRFPWHVKRTIERAGGIARVNDDIGGVKERVERERERGREGWTARWSG